MNNIACYFLTDFGDMEKALLPKDMLVKLATNFRRNGAEQVHFKEKSINVEEIYIPAKKSKHSLVILPNIK